MGLPRYDGDSYFLADFLNFAQRRRCAAAILSRHFTHLPPFTDRLATAVYTSERRKRRVQSSQLFLYAITFLLSNALRLKTRSP